MSLSCPDGADCWVGGVNSGPSSGKSAIDLGTTPAVVASTSDGGATWQDAQLPQGVGAIVDISCPSESSCYALAVQEVNRGSNAPQPFVLLAYENARRRAVDFHDDQPASRFWQFQWGETGSLLAAAPQYA